MTNLKTILLSSFTASVLWFFPVEVLAQEGFVSCSGLECNACHLVDMGNTILNWLIGVLFVVFAVVMAAAGWGLVTSAGNQSALDSAKSKFTNAFIGLFIVLAAWLIVDTIMRGLISTGDGTIEGFGPWSQVECRTPLMTQWVREDVVLGSFEGVGDTFTALTPEEIATLGVGEDSIVEFARQMDALNCSYSQPLRNGCRGNPAYTDCSDLVNNAYQAAGCRSPGTYTGDMIGNARPFSSNTELRAGDALIHRTNGAGHIVICQDDGCSSVIHAAGTRSGIIVSNGSNYYGDPRYTRAIRAADYCD